MPGCGDSKDMRVIDAPYTLVDAVSENKQNPGTYDTPSEETRRRLPPQTTAKLVFDLKDGDAERMWVIVDRREGGSQCVGLEPGPIRILERGFQPARGPLAKSSDRRPSLCAGHDPMGTKSEAGRATRLQLCECLPAVIERDRGRHQERDGNRREAERILEPLRRGGDRIVLGSELAGIGIETQTVARDRDPADRSEDEQRDCGG